MQAVNCQNCADFILDKVSGSPQAIGRCAAWTKGIAAGATKEQIERAYKARGNKPFRGTVDRFCVMFNEKT